MRRVTIPGDVVARLSRLAAPGRDGRHSLTPGDCRMLAARCRVADWDVGRPAQIVRAILEGRAMRPAGDPRRIAIATLALGFPVNAPSVELPPAIRALYAPAFRQLARCLAAERDYDDDAFAKDVRFVLGLSVPAGAQDVDLAWRKDLVGGAGRLKRTLAGLGRLALSGDAPGMAAFIAAQPRRPWLQIHTDARRLDDFHPEGWDQCYRRIADLLALHPEYAGMVGLSWFYDPAVAVISPRLAYLQARPMENGAVRIRMGASAVDVERATRTSGTRRSLHRLGLYRPRCWAIYWPREAMLRWADGSEAGLARFRPAA